jgi:hypothetical protein
VHGREANLVSARTRLEALVGEVELLDTERTCLLFVIVEYERVLLHAFGHGGCVCGVTRAEGSWWCMWIATLGSVLREGAGSCGRREVGVGKSGSQKAETPAGDARSGQVMIRRD